MTMSDEFLKNKVDATNRANRVANEFEARLHKILSNYVGKKVLKINPFISFVKALSHSIELLREETERLHGVKIGKHVSHYRVDFTIFVYFDTNPQDNYSRREETTAWVSFGNITNHVLTDIPRQIDRKTDYDYAKVKAAREKAIALFTQYREANGECSPFNQDFR